MGLGLRARGQEWRLGARARTEIYGSGTELGVRAGG